MINICKGWVVGAKYILNKCPSNADNEKNKQLLLQRCFFETSVDTVTVPTSVLFSRETSHGSNPQKEWSLLLTKEVKKERYRERQKRSKKKIETEKKEQINKSQGQSAGMDGTQEMRRKDVAGLSWGSGDTWMCFGGREVLRKHQWVTARFYKGSRLEGPGSFVRKH